jgi:hypothetical protein
MVAGYSAARDKDMNILKILTLLLCVSEIYAEKELVSLLSHRRLLSI